MLAISVGCVREKIPLDASAVMIILSSHHIISFTAKEKKRSARLVVSAGLMVLSRANAKNKPTRTSQNVYGRPSRCDITALYDPPLLLDWIE